MATSTELSKSGGSLTKKMDTPSGEGSSTSDAAKKRMERMKKLRELNLRRNEARKMNHQEVIEEDKRNKRPANWEARQRRVDWELQEEDAKKAAAERGEDYERVKMLQTTADELDRLDRKRKKKNPDQGFSDYSASQYRQYQRLTKQMKPDLNEYKEQKEEMDESELYPTVDNVSYGGAGKVSEAAVDRMVNDLEKQIEKRAKYSRRRPLYDEAGIDFINERNMKFNKKLARFYDPFTAEIKQNLERGTAV